MQDHNQENIKKLQEAITKDDTSSIYDLSSNLLSTAPNDLQYLQCFCLSAIRLAHFNELKQGIFKEKPTDKNLENYYYYYLYASADYTRLIQALEGNKNASLQLLLAQAYFKLLEYDKSAKIMANLLKSSKLNDEQKETYLINLLANNCEPKVLSEFLHMISDNCCKQVLYNYALWLLKQGKKEQGVSFLAKFAKGLDKKDEMDWMTVKLLQDYLSFEGMRAGEMVDQNKQKQYHAFLKSIDNPNLRCVVTTNLGFLNPTEAESIKTIDQFFDLSFKLSSDQDQLLKINKLSMLLRKNKIPESSKLIKDLENKSSLLSNAEYLRNRFYFLKKSKENNSVEKLIEEVRLKDPILGFCLMADLALENKNHKRILETLQNKNQSSNEAIKNFIFSLLIQNQSLFQEFEAYLEELIAKSQQVQIFQVLLKLYESKGDAKKQTIILNRILQINPKNILAKIALAEKHLGEGEIEKAQNYLRAIEGPQEITDLNYLQYIERNIHVSKKQEEKAQTMDIKKQKKRIHKKKKKPRLPKNIQTFIQNFKPNPQRWLPKWQRKGYKKKGKKGMEKKTQGLSTVGMQEKNTFFSGQGTSTKEVTKESKRRR